MKLKHVNLGASDVGTLARTLKTHFVYRILVIGTVPGFP